MPPATKTALGRIASLHLHPEKAGKPFSDVSEIEVEAGSGIVGEPRYYQRKNRHGQASRRHVTLIEREQVAGHAAALNAKIPPGLVRSNVETTGVVLISLIGQKIQIGEAVLLFYEPRLPCDQMDRLIPGMRLRMCDKRQGVIAEVVKSGRIKIGDELRPVE
jgi:MOSC domain-containing protein YiiM